MYLAFFAWYKGLAMGGIVRVGQLQLLQPFLTLAGAAIILGEAIYWSQVIVAIVVLICVILGRRSMPVPVPGTASNPGRGESEARGQPCFVRATEEWRIRRYCHTANCPEIAIRTPQRKLYAKAKQETFCGYALENWARKGDNLNRPNKRRMVKCACLGVKNIGKPCAG